MNDQIAVQYKYFLYCIFGEKITDNQCGPLSQEAIDNLEMCLQTLSEREETLLKARFGILDGEPKTFDELAEILGISRDEVIEIERNSIRKMRHPSRSETLRPFLDDEHV